MFPFPDPPSGPGARPGVEPRERGRLVLLGVALLLVVGMIAGAFVLARTGGEAKPAGPARDPLAVGTTGPGPIVEFKPEPLFPEEEGQEVEARLRERLAAFKDIVDGVPAVDPAPFALLLDEVTSNARVMNLLKEGFDRKADLAALVKDPAANRGRLVSVSGALLSLSREPFASPSGLVKEVRRGLIHDGAGRLVSFSWPVGNPLEPDPVAPGDGWAQVQGIFYKSWPVKDPAGGAEVMTPHLVLQRRPSRDFPPVQVRDVDAAWLGQIRDATPAEMSVFDEDPLYLLVNLSRTLGPEGFEAWAKGKQASSPGLRIWPPEDLTGRYRELLEHPDLYRLRPVSYSGFLVKPSEVTRGTIRPNPGNVERLWVGYLVDQDFAPAVWVYTPWSLVERGIKNLDRVKVEGFFVKRVAYEPAGGGRMMRAAVIVATRVTPAPLGTQPWGKGVLFTVLGLMVLLAGGLAWAIVQGRRDDEASRRRRQEKLSRKRAAGPGPFAAGPDARA